MKTITELLFITKKFGNKLSEMYEFLEYLRSNYVSYIDFEILEQDDLSTIEVYGIREITDDDLKKCYIVVEESWEYNDESYYQPEDEGYTLTEPKLYTKQEAEQICDKFNKSMDNDRFATEEGIAIQPFKIIKLEI